MSVQSTYTTIGFERFDGRALRAALRAHLKIIVAVTFTVFLISMTALFLIQPFYKATALIIIEPDAIQKSDRQNEADNLTIDSNFVESQIEILKSQSLIQQVVQQLALDKDPKFNRPKRGFGSLSNFLTEKPADGRSDEATLPAVTRFGELLTVERRGTTYVISADMMTPAPQDAAKYVNALVDAYLTDQARIRSDLMNHKIVWLKDRVALLETDVNDAERQVEQFKAVNHLQDTRGVSLIEQQVANLNEQIGRANTDLMEKTTKYREAVAQTQNFGFSDSTDAALHSPIIAGLKLQLGEIARRRADLQEALSNQHPQLKEVIAQERELKRTIQAEGAKILGSMKVEINTATAQLKNLETSFAGLIKTQNRLQEKSIQLRELQRQSDSRRDIYQSLLTELKFVQQKASADEPVARIISRATAPREAAFPKYITLIPVLALFSLLCGIGAGLFLQSRSQVLTAGPIVA